MAAEGAQRFECCYGNRNRFLVGGRDGQVLQLVRELERHPLGRLPSHAAHQLQRLVVPATQGAHDPVRGQRSEDGECQARPDA